VRRAALAGRDRPRVSFRTRVAQVDESREQIVLVSVGAGKDSSAGSLALHRLPQLEHQPLGRLFADARGAGQARYVSGRQRSNELGCVDPREDVGGEARTDTRDGDESLKELVLGGRSKAKERERILAHMGVDAEVTALSISPTR